MATNFTSPHIIIQKPLQKYTTGWQYFIRNKHLIFSRSFLQKQNNSDNYNTWHIQKLSLYSHPHSFRLILVPFCIQNVVINVNILLIIQYWTRIWNTSIILTHDFHADFFYPITYSISAFKVAYTFIMLCSLEI